MKIELLLKFPFEASHSLAGYEEPHPHLWRLEAGITGKMIEGKIVDMISLRSSIQKVLEPLILTYLNENIFVSPDVRKFPTCESLCEFFSTEINRVLLHEFQFQNPSIQLSSILVAICEMDGTETGAVKTVWN